MRGTGTGRGSVPRTAGLAPENVAGRHQRPLGLGDQTARHQLPLALGDQGDQTARRQLPLALGDQGDQTARRQLPLGLGDQTARRQLPLGLGDVRDWGLMLGGLKLENIEPAEFCYDLSDRREHFDFRDWR